MPSPSNKKLLILYVLEILKEYSDENHPLMQEEICNKIYSSYGMECERKAVAANLQSLADYGYDVMKVPNKGVYLGEREFEQSEIAFLVDAVFSSRVINSKHSKDLAEKFFSFLSVNQRKKYKYVYKADEIIKTDNKQLILNIDLLGEAIERKKKVRFKYVGYSAQGKKYREFVVSPYFMLNRQGAYYLVCCLYEDTGLINYKIDNMTELSIVDEAAQDVKQIKGCENGLDIAKYANENIYMFGGRSVKATLKTTDEQALRYVHEWFGANVKVKERDGELFVEVYANEMALTYWALQYGEIVELIKPPETREKIAKVIKLLQKKYELI